MARRALVIANSQYDDERFAQLPAAKADAAALTGVLSDPAIGDFTVEQMVDVGQRAATRAIQSFFSGAERDDLLVLHLSLHGWKDLQNRLYFVARDTERDLLEATAISADFVNERMSQSRSRRIVLMLDCCYSGAFTAGLRPRSAEAPRVDVTGPFDGRGRIVITASTALQFAHESHPEVLLSQDQALPSPFTAAVVQGLKDGSADLDRDGRISVTELYDYVQDQVRRTIPGQTPTLSVDRAEGAIYLVEHCGGFADTDVLADLHPGITDPRAWMRRGALHRIEQLLGSVREPVREAAQIALLTLIADNDPEVAQHAQELWHRRGLGEIPDVGQARRPHGRPQAGTQFFAGIDFGTTNSAIGVFDNGDVRMIPNAEGTLTTPSLVALTADGQALVGTAAKRQAINNPEYTVASVKLKLGTDWSIERAGKRYAAEDIAALILARLRSDAEAYLGGSLGGAVLTVPANFRYAQRYALRKAAEMAGINVLRILNEPTSASITYGLNRDEEQTVLVVDMGGGTFDVSLLGIGLVVNVCEVMATNGDNHLGGDDWDQRIVDWLVKDFKNGYGIDLSKDKMALPRLREAAEKAKIELSQSMESQINLPYISHSADGPLHLDAKLTRAEFQRMTSDLLDRCKGPFQQVIKDAGLKLADITHVILVGGATRMPAVADLVKEVTGGKQAYRGLIPEGIVTGAALQAGVLTGGLKDFLLLDVIPLSLGIETRGGIFTKLLERNTTLPTKRSEIFTTVRDNQESVTIHVLEGEREIAKYNSTLAIFELSGILSAPRGEPQIEVTFDIDANGILGVRAKDLGTGHAQSVAVNRDSLAEAAEHRRSARWPQMLATTLAPSVPLKDPPPAAPRNK